MGTTEAGGSFSVFWCEERRAIKPCKEPGKAGGRLISAEVQQSAFRPAERDAHKPRNVGMECSVTY